MHERPRRKEWSAVFALTGRAEAANHPPVSAAQSSPLIRLRGRSFMALVLTPEPPTEAWIAAFRKQITRSPGFFDSRPVIVDLGLLPPTQPDVADLIQTLVGCGVRVIGTENAHPAWPGVARWGGPIGRLAADPSNNGANAVRDEPAASAGPRTTALGVPHTPPAAEADHATLLVEHAVRSGQQIVNEAGDVTILGAVAWGAEVVAGGSIHVYGALRGRAIAGFSGNKRARIFCRRLEAELIAIDGVYETADEWDPALHRHPAQIWLADETLMFAPMD